MPLRICLVTPFSWSQPHDVNEHVAGVAGALRDRGHSVSVLAPSNRAADLTAGRRALRDGVEAPLIALGPAVPISRRSRIGLPGRSARQPRDGPRPRPVRRRPRLRARAAEPLLPRPSRRPRADRGELLLAGAARLSAREGAAREAPRPDRRARRRLAGGRACSVSTVSGRVPDRPRRRRPGSLPSHGEAKARRPRMAPRRARALQGGAAGDARASRLGARLPTHEEAGRTADDPGQAPRARARAHRP